MSHSHFGYYIHGKSAHGSADTDMEGLLNQLQREADDLCGHRGLQAGSDQQTFSMILPATLRTYYDKVGKGEKQRIHIHKSQIDCLVQWMATENSTNCAQCHKGQM